MTFKKEVVEFLKPLGKVSILIKIMGIILALVILLGSWVTSQVQSTLTRTLRGQLDQQGIIIARDLAARSTDYIFTNNIFSLYELNKETIDNNNNIRYAFIMDSSGRVLVHSFERSLPKGLRNLNPIKEGQRSNIKIIDTDEGIIHDIAVPIFEGRAGIIRVGMSEKAMNRIIRSTTGWIIFSTMIIALLGVLGAHRLTTLVTRPILKLINATEDVSRGNLQIRVPLFWSLDEFSRLGQAFNEMVESMEKSRDDNTALWKELKKKEEMRIKLLSKVITAQEEERKRIARELHDQTGQALTSLMVGLKNLENIQDTRILKEKTDELRDLASRTFTEVHDLALFLRPSVLDDLGLIDALQRYIKDYSKKYDIEVGFHTQGLNKFRLPPQIETTVYRIIQEALTNIVKHAQAHNVGVILEGRGNILELIIEDDGRGFNVKEVMEAPLEEKRLGLFGMEERVALVGGNLTIESEVGFGTTLFINVPMGG